MYPFASLPENVAAFCARLRDAFDFRIGAAEVRDAARALEVVSIGDERQVRHALRAVLGSRREDLELFDAAFTEFFFGSRGVPQSGLPPTAPHEPRIDDRSYRKGEDAPREGEAAEDDDGASEEGDARNRPNEPIEETADAEHETARLVRAAWSPLPALAPPLAIAPADQQWRAAARAFVRSVRVGQSRRWSSAPRGQRFDMRRTLRASLHTGGETLVPRWLARRRRQPRFVLLIDGSRSMSPHAGVALDVAVALASVSSRVDVFTFSTRLRSVTAEVRRAAAGGRERLTDLSEAWGGGTAIGASLRAFLATHGERLLGRATIVLIASDGLDSGQPDTLREAMHDLCRSSAGIVWLNPLLRTNGYEPTALGMRVALPYIATFAAVGEAADLAALARGLRLRM
jgi:uncharacterized protein with von Willebrand factor type A (vWA) domain